MVAYRSIIAIIGATSPAAQAAAVTSAVIRHGRSTVFHCGVENCRTWDVLGLCGMMLEEEGGLCSGALFPSDPLILSSLKMRVISSYLQPCGGRAASLHVTCIGKVTRVANVFSL